MGTGVILLAGGGGERSNPEIDQHPVQRGVLWLVCVFTLTLQLQ